MTKTHSIHVLANKACTSLQTFLPVVIEANSHKATENKYIIFGLLVKAGYTHTEIGDYFKMNRDNVCKALAKLEVWKKAYKDIRGNCERLENTLLKEV